MINRLDVQNYIAQTSTSHVHNYFLEVSKLNISDKDLNWLSFQEKLFLQSEIKSLSRYNRQLDHRVRSLEEQLQHLQQASFLYPKNTKGLSGINLRLAEFSNTIKRKLFGARFQNIQNRYFMNVINNFKNLIKDNSDQLLNNLLLTNNERLLFDVTGSMHGNRQGGIQRVVVELACVAIANLGAIPVYLSEGFAYTYDPSLDRLIPLQFQENDVFFAPDSSWEYIDDIRKVMSQISFVGGKNIFLVHDIIPLIYPELWGDYLPYQYLGWFQSCVTRADAVICVSQSAAKDVLNYITLKEPKDYRRPPIGWIHLASEVKFHDDRLVSNKLKEFTAKQPNYFLTVSTIEPRKGYKFSLEAMEELWAEGSSYAYVIAGRYGWGQEILRDRILNHPELGRRLLWLDNASDSDVTFLYQNAHRLIMPSIAEGFGLPVIEAAYYGLPAILSDIDVFREVAGENGEYFEAMNSKCLAKALKESVETPKKSIHISVKNWSEVGIDIKNMIDNNLYQFQ